MLNKKARVFLASLMVSAMVFAACTPGEGGGTTAEQNAGTSTGGGAATTSNLPPVRIGALLPLTGDDALDGQNQRNAHEFAVERINAAGGIAALGGAPIEIVWGDTQGSVEIGNAEIERLIVNENVVAILGAFHSGVTLSAVRIAEQYQVPFLNPNALSVEITQQGFAYTFQTTPTTFDLTRMQGEVVSYLSERFGTDVNTIGIIRNDGFIGNQMINGWQEHLPKQGFEIVVDAVFPPAATNIQSAVLSLISADPDVVVSQANAQEALLVIRTFRELDWWPRYGFVAAGAGYSNPDVLSGLGELAEGIIIVNDWFPWNNRPGNSEELNAAFRARYGTDMIANANTTYAATWILKEALEQAGVADPVVLGETMRNLHLVGGVTEFMYDFVRFNEIGLNEGTVGLAAQVQNGELMTIWPQADAIVDPIWPVVHWSNR